MNSKNALILSTAYLPTVHYIAKLSLFEKVLVEANENYQKQSYRNRCVILGSNGPLTLTIPVIKVHGNNTNIKDIVIDYSTNWQKNHWKAIESAYRTSTYFEFIADFLNKYYINKYNSLLEYNTLILRDILNFLNIKSSIEKTNSFIHSYTDDFIDFRRLIHPKKHYIDIDNTFQPISYYQIFNHRFDFQPNLSIIDLLFNEGLDSPNILKRSIRE